MILPVLQIFRQASSTHYLSKSKAELPTNTSCSLEYPWVRIYLETVRSRLQKYLSYADLTRNPISHIFLNEKRVYLQMRTERIRSYLYK